MKTRLLLCALVLLVATHAADAGSISTNLSISVLVNANCTISSGALAFGNYDPATTNATTALNGTANMALACTSAAPATVTLGQGTNANSGSTDSAPLRRLKNGSSFLSYSIYQDSGQGTAWGNTTGTGVAYTGTGTAGSLTAYAAIPGGQNVPPGGYTDTVVVTIAF